MSLAKGDRSLQEILDWASGRLAEAGYPIRSQVRLLVDPKLEFMGYAREQDGIQQIVISSWAVHSEMLGGLVFHELAHIYHSEHDAPSHRPDVINGEITEYGRREGLSPREVGYLVESFSHLQNVMVDDIVFKVMKESEKLEAQRFFVGWVTSAASGHHLTDSSALVRNAFAIASLARRGLLGGQGEEAVVRNKRLLNALGARAPQRFEEIERFLETADAGWNETEFRENFLRYIDLLVGLLREKEQLEDLR